MIDARAVAADVLREAGLDDGRVRIVQLNRSGPQGDFVVLLVFSGGAALPSLLIKMTRDPKKAASLARESENLTRLHESGSAALRRSLPEPLRLKRIGDLTVFAETALGGTRMKNLPPDRYFASAEFPRRLDDVVAFLTELHRCGEAMLSPGETPIRELVATYRSGFEVGPALDRLMNETADRLAERSFPTSPWHGDFCTANVLVEEGLPLGVIDWEFPLAREWPLADLLHFLSSVWCIPYRKGREASIERYRTLFFGEHGLRDVLRDRARAYLRELGIDAGDALPLSVAAWLLYATRKRAALAAMPGAERRADDEWPLVLFEGRRCLNLELLAENSERYLLGDLASNHDGNP